MMEQQTISRQTMFSHLSPCDMDSPYIFVSYSSRDWFRVCTDVYELQRRGYNIWIDEKNLDKKKDSWKEDALGAIRSYCCEFVIFYVSEASLTSEQCLAEMEETFSQETVDYHAGDPVQFICIDAEQIGDIQKVRNRIKETIKKDASLSTAEKNLKSHTLSVFLRVIFNSNNERVRVHPADEPDRRSDYYSEILQSLPPDTKVSEEKEKNVGQSVEEDIVRPVDENIDENTDGKTGHENENEDAPPKTKKRSETDSMIINALMSGLAILLAAIGLAALSFVMLGANMLVRSPVNGLLNIMTGFSAAEADIPSIPVLVCIGAVELLADGLLYYLGHRKESVIIKTVSIVCVVLGILTLHLIHIALLAVLKFLVIVLILLLVLWILFRC